MATSRRLPWGVVAVIALGAVVGASAWLLRARMPWGRDSGAPAGSPVSLPAPRMAERATGTGSARLSWNPVASEDPADPIAGFRVYAGESPDALQLEVSIADPQAVSFVVERLPAGAFYFSVTSFTRLGIESPRPPPVSKTIE